MRSPRRAGMTLVELLVTLAVMAIVIAGISQALSAFQTIYTVQSYKRQANAAGRQGIAVMERDLRAAGFGIEPALAFDFSLYRGDGQPCGGTFATNPCVQPNAANARDRTDGPDQLVFYSREANYWGGDSAGEPEGWAWQVVSAGGISITLRGHLFKQTIRKGQILQVVCAGAAQQAYVTVNGANTTSTGADDANITLTLTLDDPSDPFKQTTLVTTNTNCFGQTSSRAFLVNRYRYYVNPALLLPDNQTDSFLMLDTGLDRDGDNQVTAADDIPVARGVVDLQVGYLRPDGGGVAGATEEVGTTIAGALQACSISIPAAAPALPLSKIALPVSCANGLQSIDYTSGAVRYAQYSYFPADITDPLRRSEDAGNISAVHVVVVARSEGAVRALSATRAPATMNRGPLTIPPDAVNRPYAYSVQETMIPVRNTIAASMLSYL